MENIHTLESILKQLGYKDLTEAAKDHAKLILLSKISKFESEDNSFQRKYKSDFLSFFKKINSKKQEENFEEDDDLMDWQFAFETLQLYKKQLEIIS